MKLHRRQFLALCAGATLSACGRGAMAGGDAQVWGRHGHRNGEFVKPRAIAVRDGRVYVVDTTGRVQVFSESGEFLLSWRTPDASNGTPTAVGFGLEGRILVPDTHYGRILEYSPEGELLDEWGEYGSDAGQFIYPTGIVQTSSGVYFISEYGDGAERVQAFTKDRKPLRTWGTHGDAPGEFNRAMAIAIDASGDLFVADTANHRVQRFSQAGELIGVIGEAGTQPGQLSYPYDLSLAPDGTLAISEYDTHRISRFTKAGDFLGAYGEAGRAAGRFNAPRGVAVGPDGTLFVADTDNHRVQRIEARAWI